MTFQEIENNLPNGLHDAGIVAIEIDYEVRSAVLTMEIHVGTPDDPDPERYRRGVIRVTSICLFTIEPPDARYSFIPDGTSIWVQGDPVPSGQDPAIDAAVSVLPPGSTVYRFFVVDWNSFIYIAGADAAFSWQDEKRMEGQDAD